MQKLPLARDCALAAIHAVEADKNRAATARREQPFTQCGLGPDAICGAQKRQVAPVEPLRVGHYHVAAGLVQELRPDMLEHEIHVVRCAGARTHARGAQTARARGKPRQ